MKKTRSRMVSTLVTAIGGALLFVPMVPQGVAAPAYAQAAPAQQQAQQTVMGLVAKDQAGRYVLQDTTGTTYQLTDQDAAKKYEGKKVKVTGAVDPQSKTIRVAQIAPAS